MHLYIGYLQLSLLTTFVQIMLHLHSSCFQFFDAFGKKLLHAHCFTEVIDMKEKVSFFMIELLRELTALLSVKIDIIIYTCIHV